MTAREKFRKGERVRLTALAEKNRLRIFNGGRGTKGERVYTGVVVGFGEAGTAVRVQPDGRKTATVYLMDYWERDGEKP